MTFHKDIPYLEHILDAIKDMEDSTESLSKSDFIKNKDVRDANVRRLEIIGEAVKNISEEIKRKYPNIEWKKIAATRDKIIHHYFGIDFGMIWNIIIKDIPLLKEKIQNIKEKL